MNMPSELDDPGISHASLSCTGSGSLTLWSSPQSTCFGETSTDARLELHPDRPVVVGRQDGGEVPYLDPAYVPTRIVPDSGQPVLTEDPNGMDFCVSRGHFLLRAVAAGVMLVNGVPQRGGGVRTPLNGTRVVEPEQRRLDDAEEYLIETGKAARFELPNGTLVLIHAG